MENGISVNSGSNNNSSETVRSGKRIVRYLLQMPIAQIVRYLISGCPAAATHLLALYALVEFAGLHYLSASAIALGVAIIVSFSLHKFFTFREHNLSHAHIQFGLYLCVVGINFVTNLALMWFSVELLRVPYLLAAIIAGVAVAIVNFFAYRLFVFQRR